VKIFFFIVIFFNKFRGCFTINKDLLINEEIREKEVRVIGNDGAQLGIMSSKAALETAAAKNLDLVLIAPKAVPPTCKIMDYGKYRFEMAKREKENRKNQKIVSIKEVRLSPSIDTHDFETKLKSAVKFLQGGDKVKVTVRFRGREVHHSALGEELLERFAQGVAEVGSVDKKPKLEGRNMAMFIVPKN
jgi:translation initiation factor IF-3